MLDSGHNAAVLDYLLRGDVVPVTEPGGSGRTSHLPTLEILGPRAPAPMPLAPTYFTPIPLGPGNLDMGYGRIWKRPKLSE